MKLTVLSENCSLIPPLSAEYGLSVYLEQGGTRLLFDAGCYGGCLDNARALGIDLHALTAIAFSHNHRDHCGGFVRLAGELRPACPVYAHAGFFRRKWWDHSADPVTQPTYENTLELVGPPMDSSFFFQQRITGFRLLSADVFPLGDDVYLLGNFPVPTGIESVHPSSVMEDAAGQMVRDTFRDEQVCVVRTKKGLVVLTGCAHNGIMNILETVKQRFPGEPVCAVFGGTHLVPPDTRRIEETAAYFARSSLACAGVCHCTGPEGTEAFSRLVPSYVPTGAGFTWEAD
ncbi:MAG: MBL fold metallo-hydrolase [Clostridiales bacterium]|nr:MBL fold metallo-hydrolase [Clostridiales bacterium]